MDRQTVDDMVLQAIYDTVESTDEQLFVVNPNTTATIDAVVEALDTLDTLQIRILAGESTLSKLNGAFELRARLAKHAGSGRLSLHRYDGSTNTLLVDRDAVVLFSDIGDETIEVRKAHSQFLTDKYEQFCTEACAATRVDLDTPSITRIRSTLSDALGTDPAEEFDRVLRLLPDCADSDAATVALLVAGRHEKLYGDLSTWGEALGVASNATFSRKKTELIEEHGLIETEAISRDVGRPPLRLRPADTSLRDASVDDLADLAKSVL
ncbi:MAG: DUF5821 family protein [Natronomonas sp.]